MTTYTYLKKGRMGQRPYHLLAEDGCGSLCGRVQVDDEGAGTVATAPEPMADGLICAACLRVSNSKDKDDAVTGEPMSRDEALAAIRRVTEGRRELV